MKRYARVFASFLLIPLLTVSTPSWPCFAEWRTVSAGWTATEPGVFGTLEDGRDTLAALRYWRRTSDVWKAAYEGLREEFLSTTNELSGQLDALEKQLNEERKAWKAAVDRKRARTVLCILVASGIGYAAGR